MKSQRRKRKRLSKNKNTFKMTNKWKNLMTKMHNKRVNIKNKMKEKKNCR